MTIGSSEYFSCMKEQMKCKLLRKYFLSASFKCLYAERLLESLGMLQFAMLYFSVKPPQEPPDSPNQPLLSNVL